MRYKVSCTKPDCHLHAAWYETAALAEFVAAAHHFRTNDQHRVDVTEYKPNPPPAESFKPDTTGVAGSGC